MSISVEYASFLVRMWREDGPEPGGLQVWRSEVEHVQTGQRWTFETLEELLDFLRREGAGSGDANG